MRARKCDRCGSFYENNKNRDGYNFYGVGTLAEKSIGTVRNFDLCDKCLDEFERFMAYEDKTSEVENDISDPSPCEDCKVLMKESCCGCIAYFEWRKKYDD